MPFFEVTYADDTAAVVGAHGVVLTCRANLASSEWITGGVDHRLRQSVSGGCHPPGGYTPAGPSIRSS